MARRRNGRREKKWKEREKVYTPQPYRRKTPTGGSRIANTTSRKVSAPMIISSFAFN